MKTIKTNRRRASALVLTLFVVGALGAGGAQARLIPTGAASAGTSGGKSVRLPNGGSYQLCLTMLDSGSRRSSCVTVDRPLRAASGVLNVSYEANQSLGPIWHTISCPGGGTGTGMTLENISSGTHVSAQVRGNAAGGFLNRGVSVSRDVVASTANPTAIATACVLS